MLSLSSSSCSSHMVTISSKRCFSCSVKFRAAIILASRSKIFTAKKRSLGPAILLPASFLMAFKAASTSSEKRRYLGALPLAAAIAASAAFLVPSPRRAEVSTMVQPSSFVKRSISKWSPFLRTISIIFMAIATGIPISKTWVVRYRLRSILEPSTKFKIASTLLSKR